VKRAMRLGLPMSVQEGISLVEQLLPTGLGPPVGEV